MTTTERILKALQIANVVRSLENEEWEDADLIDGNPEEEGGYVLCFPSGDNATTIKDLEEATISEDGESFTIGNTTFYPQVSTPVKI